MATYAMAISRTATICQRKWQRWHPSSFRMLPIVLMVRYSYVMKVRPSTHVGNNITDKLMIGIIKKYKLWKPCQMLRFAYYNFSRIRKKGKSFFVPSPFAVFDIHKTASITLNNTLVFGWCNMKSSKMETALCMSKGAQLQYGGVNPSALT